MGLLSDELFFMFEEDEDGLEDIIEKVSLWIVDGEMIRPSGKISILQKLNPGFYKVDIHRDYGLFCKKITASSDELFTFSDSLIPKLVDEINTFWDKADAYKTNKLIHKRGMLLAGFPGTGKSSIISLLSNEIAKRKGVVFNVTDPSNLNLYINYLKDTFRQIEPDTPVITIIEDIDKYEESSVILDFLDGKSQIEHHVIIATSNNTTRIPGTLLRPSRIDLIYEVPLPCEKTRREYFIFKGVEEELIDELVSKTNDFSLADLKELYITVFLLDYTIEAAISKIKKPSAKKDYTSEQVKKSKFGL